MCEGVCVCVCLMVCALTCACIIQANNEALEHDIQELNRSALGKLDSDEVFEFACMICVLMLRCVALC